MKKILLILFYFCTVSVAYAQFAISYFQVYDVLDLNDRSINSSHKGFPVMLQTGGSQYTGYFGYINLANLGNLQYSMTLDRTRDGYYIYATPSLGGGYSMTDMYGNQYYMMINSSGNDLVFVVNNAKYRASSINYSTYMSLTGDLIKNNPDYYRSYGPGNHSSGQKETKPKDGRTCEHCHGSGKCSSCVGDGYMFNPYTGNKILCPNCEKKYNGICKFCHGRGKRYD